MEAAQKKTEELINEYVADDMDKIFCNLVCKSKGFSLAATELDPAPAGDHALRHYLQHLLLLLPDAALCLQV